MCRRSLYFRLAGQEVLSKEVRLEFSSRSYSQRMYLREWEPVSSVMTTSLGEKIANEKKGTQWVKRSTEKEARSFA